MLSTSFASPTLLLALTSTASPGWTMRRSASVASVDGGDAVDGDAAVKRFVERPHLLADQDQAVDVGRQHGGREAGVKRVAMLAKLAHRAEHGDAARDVLAPRRGC